MISYVYTLIYNNIIPVVIKPILEVNKKICKKNGLEFRIENFEVNPGESIAGKSDLVRVTKASIEPNILYVDWDCEILKIPYTNPKIPMFGIWHKTSSRDIWALYNGTCTDMFLDIIERTKNIPIYSATSSGRFYGIINTPEFIDKASYFTVDSLYHIALGAGTEIKPALNKEL